MVSDVVFEGCGNVQVGPKEELRLTNVGTCT